MSSLSVSLWLNLFTTRLYYKRIPYYRYDVLLWMRQWICTHGAFYSDPMMTSIHVPWVFTKLKLVLASTLNISHALLKSHLLDTLGTTTYWDLLLALKMTHRFLAWFISFFSLFYAEHMGVCLLTHKSVSDYLLAHNQPSRGLSSCGIFLIHIGVCLTHMGGCPFRYFDTFFFLNRLNHTTL